MAFVLSNNKAMSLMLLCVTLSLMFLHGNSTEFMVGESNGWGVPPPKDPNTYNHWAEKKRFKVNDTLEFRYKKDSVMEVIEAEYDKCRSSVPIFFTNKGDTKLRLNRSGLYYFISGVTGHCERGQKMVVKVLDVESPPEQTSPPANEGDNNTDDKKKKNGATHFKYIGVTSMLFAIVGFVIVA